MAMIVGCARPGGSNQATAPSTRTSDPGVQLAACVDPALGSPSSTAPSSTAPSMTAAATGPVSEETGPQSEERERGEAFQRNRDANKAFRDRRALPPDIVAANQPCVDKVRTALDRLRAERRYDEASITDVLKAAGLVGGYARRAGRLDTAGSGGLLFAGETGQGCVFGEHGPVSTTVEFGSGIADGGCLPAQD